MKFLFQVNETWKSKPVELCDITLYNSLNLHRGNPEYNQSDASSHE